jgi:cystathionine beta-synthase
VVGPDDSLTTAHNRLRNAGFSQLPVMKGNKLVGIITEDTIIRFVFGKPEMMNRSVSDAMETAFIELNKDTSINNLVSLLHVQPYAAITNEELFLGLITRSDVLNYLRKKI